jgi:sister chromatid cohesion PDS5-like protein
VATQDSCYEVRNLFLTKLLTLLQPRKLPPYFNVIPFLTVIDPEADIKNMVSDWLEGYDDAFLNSDFRLLPTLKMLSAEFLQVRGL